MTCQELVELVSDYFDGVLAAEDRARFEAHVAECAGCDRYVEQMRVTLALTRATGELQGRQEVTALMDLFRDWKRTDAA